MFQHLNEWNALLNYIGKLESFIEIGTHKGGTFSSLAFITSGKKISIDLCSGNFGGIGPEAAAFRNKNLQALFENTYLIEGDSKKTDTVKQLADILQGEKVSFLFIDGDHTYQGVLSDYLVYRQFVKPQGFIAFHDIVDSESHRRAGCFVSKLWQKLNGVEFISPDNSDAVPDARKKSDKVWGGIGVVKNEFSGKVPVAQQFSDQQSLDKCISLVKEDLPELILI